MLKELYKFLFKVKYNLFGSLYKNIPLNSPNEAREFLENSYELNHKETDYNEKFLFEPSIDLSIIIPVYNLEDKIKECIDSVIQPSNFSYEIIIIDDGSTDDSGKICDEYAEKYDMISIFHIENSGISFARNLGITHSKGKYLMFVDGDDYIEPNTLDGLLSMSKGYDIVQGLYKKVNDISVYYKSKKISSQSAIDFSVEYGYVWGKLYKREIFENVKFPLGFWFEDMINDVVIYPSNYSHILVDKYFYNYVANKKGITSSSKNSLKILDSYFVLEEIIKNFDKFNIEFSPLHFKRFLYQCSHQIFVRLRRYDIKYMENVFVLLCELVDYVIKKYKIETSSLPKYSKKLVSAFETKNFKQWKEISVFFK